MGTSDLIAQHHTDIQALVSDAKKRVTVQKVNVTPRLDVNTFTVNLHKLKKLIVMNREII